MNAAPDLSTLVDQPFELLRELERRSRAAIAGKGTGEVPEEWTGIGFRIGQESFVADREQVREVLMLPETMTRGPVAKRWLLGNVTYIGSWLTTVASTPDSGVT